MSESPFVVFEKQAEKFFGSTHQRQAEKKLLVRASTCPNENRDEKLGRLLPRRQNLFQKTRGVGELFFETPMSWFSSPIPRFP